MYGSFVALCKFNTVIKSTSLTLSEFYIGLEHEEHYLVSTFLLPTVHQEGFPVLWKYFPLVIKMEVSVIQTNREWLKRKVLSLAFCSAFRVRRQFLSKAGNAYSFSSLFNLFPLSGLAKILKTSWEPLEAIISLKILDAMTMSYLGQEELISWSS